MNVISASFAAIVAALTTTHCFAAAAPVSPWAELARADIVAIRESVLSIHPGVRDPQNANFVAGVKGSVHSALVRASDARSFLDWRNAVGGFVQSFRDGHTFIRYNAQPSRVRWPGFLIDRQGSAYVATALEADAGLQRGDRLVACDGVPIDSLLESRLDGQEADWRKAPERITQAWRLFVDYEVDSPPPVRSCTVDRAGVLADITLAWRLGSTPALLEQSARLQRRAVPRRPIALSSLPDGGALVQVGSFGDEAALAALQAAMAAGKAKLQAAPYIVFDLRGNAGGNSTWGGVFGRIVFGDAAVDALGEPSSGKYFRASAAAVVRLRLIASEFRAGGPAMEPVAAYWKEVADRVAASPDGDTKLFTDFVNPPMQLLERQPVSEYRGKVFVLTDAGCFSSCVVAATTLIKLGGVNVGEVMGQNEEYGEVTGPLNLPSGLGRYWLPISIIRQAKENLGGQPVAAAWTGAMDDDAGIFAWIASLVSHSIVLGSTGP